MQFQVPQYIEVEDKIVGPLSLKQFIYLAGAGGLSYILFKKLPLLIGLPFVALIVGFALMLAFYPKEKFGKPFVEILQSGFRYMLRSRLYTWKRVAPKPPPPGQVKAGTPSSQFSMPIPTISEGKLKNLSWNVDVAGDKQDEPTTDHELPATGRHEM